MRITRIDFILTILCFQFAIITAINAQPYLGYSDYQIITDKNFHAGAYFRKMSDQGVNFQRIWALGYSGTAKKFDELLPFVLTNGKYQLRSIEPRYLQRLNEVLEEAQTYDQRVMLTLFDHWALAAQFYKTPWYHKNNHERLVLPGKRDFFDVTDKKLTGIQENYVRTIVRTTRGFNPIYEIMNEAGGPSCEGLTKWHERVASWILDEAPDAEIALNITPECSELLNSPWVDVISFHHSQWNQRGICNLTKKYADKLVIIDTDGGWRYRDDNKLVKKWMNEAFACGASFNHKDDIYDLDRQFLNLYRRHQTTPKESR
jgi:hypothetical protein